MSFDLFLECIQFDGPWGLARAAVQPLFPVVAARSHSNFWVVEYDAFHTCSLALTPLPPSGELIVSIHVARPCSDQRFWEALHSILRMGPVVLLFPGGPPIVATAAARGALVRRSPASLPEPVLVAAAREILAIIQQS